MRICGYEMYIYIILYNIYTIMSYDYLDSAPLCISHHISTAWLQLGLVNQKSGAVASSRVHKCFGEFPRLHLGRNLGDVGHVPGLVNIQKIWNITIFNGKTMENSLFLWPFSIVFCVYQAGYMSNISPGNQNGWQGTCANVSVLPIGWKSPVVRSSQALDSGPQPGATN